MAEGAALERKLVKRGSTHIEYYAQGSGPLVVLLPSLGRGADDFASIRSRVAEASRVLVPQPRGIGASKGLMAGVTLHDYAGDVALVIENEGGGPALIG